MTPKRGTCAHCKRVMYLTARGLCTTCYRSPVALRYPTRFLHQVREGREMTDEQLDALVAERMANLPDWFVAELRANREDDTARRVAGVMRLRLVPRQLRV